MQLLPVIKKHGGLLTVHAESDGITNALRDSLGPQDLQPIGQARTRPNAAEASAVANVLAAARACGDAPVYIVHTSPMRAWTRYAWPGARASATYTVKRVRNTYC